MKKTKLKDNPIFSLKDLWSEHDHQVWLASSITMHRNFSKMQFPSKMDTGKQEQVLSLAIESVQQCPQLKAPTLYRSSDLDFLEKEFLLEHFLSYNGFQGAHGGEGFIIDDSGSIGLLINVDDHLQLTYIDTKQEIEKSWNELAKIESYINKRVDYAFNKQFGYLTSNPENAGTGLVVTMFLHIPAIIHMGELPELLERKGEDEVDACGLQGHATEMIGDILVATNRCSLGLAEEYILTSMRMFATKTVVSEVNARKKIVEENNEAMKNKVTRALGLLTHSYQLEAIEALNTVSLVRLGVELGWIQGADQLNLTQILFNCRRAHLMTLLEQKVDIPELPKKRAEYLQKISNKLKLVI